jgi:hypothetical protein
MYHDGSGAAMTRMVKFKGLGTLANGRQVKADFEQAAGGEFFH